MSGPLYWPQGLAIQRNKNTIENLFCESDKKPYLLNSFIVTLGKGNIKFQSNKLGRDFRKRWVRLIELVFCLLLKLYYQFIYLVSWLYFLILMFCHFGYLQEGAKNFLAWPISKSIFWYLVIALLIWGNDSFVLTYSFFFLFQLCLNNLSKIINKWKLKTDNFSGFQFYALLWHGWDNWFCIGISKNLPKKKKDTTSFFFFFFSV